MRRVVFTAALVTACLAFAVPSFAQFDPDRRWYVNAGVGSGFGNFGPTAAVDAEAGVELSDNLSVQFETGVLPHMDFEDAQGVAAPVVLPPGFNIPASDYHVNGFNVNGNIVFRTIRGRIMPYVTAGAGAYIGSTRQNLADVAAHFEYGNQSNFAGNVGGGLTVQVSRWAGIRVDYRAFVVAADETETVNRVTTGVVLFAR